MKKSSGNKKIKEKMKAEYEDIGSEDDLSYKKACLTLAKDSLNFDEVLVLTNHKDEDVRLKAVQRLCPCKVQDEYEQFWNRMFELVSDPSPSIRSQVLHNMCDGSPEHLENRIVEALEVFNRDPNQDVKRTAHKVMASYLRTGKWNIL